MFNSTKRLWVSAYLLFLSLLGWTQTGTLSPYSISGYGERVYSGNVEQIFMGRTGIASSSYNKYSIENPASLSSLQYTILDVGMRGEVTQLETSTASTTKQGANLSYAIMAFPISVKHKIGFAFGLTPYSDVGYELVNQPAGDTPVYSNIFTGDGGINLLRAGIGYEPLSKSVVNPKDSNYNIYYGLSLGAGLRYSFGSLNTTTEKRYTENPEIFSFRDKRSAILRGTTFELGVQFKRRNPLGWNHHLAASYHLGGDLDMTRNRLLQTYNGIQFYFHDTILNEEGVELQATIPSGIKFGYQISKGDKWTLNLEYQREMWSGISIAGVNDSYFDNERMAMGISWIPQPKIQKGVPKWQTIQYMAGLRVENTFMEFFGNQIQEVGMSFGLGIPVVKVQPTISGRLPIISRVNIGLEYFTRGTTENALVKENHYRVYLGLSLNDKWFNKRKYQ
jgi:long-subunit fatty acid transport protein